MNSDKEILELATAEQRKIELTSGNPGIYLCPGFRIPDGYLLICYLFLTYFFVCVPGFGIPVFQATPFKIVKIVNKNLSIDRVQNLKKKEDKYAKTLAKIQVSNFSYVRYAEKRFSQIYRDLY